MSTADPSGFETANGECEDDAVALAASGVAVLILTHGPLANELLASARAIAGDLDHFDALPLSWGDGIEETRRKLGEALPRLDRGSGVLILTDIFGGTPSNVAMAFREPGRVEVVSGVNLPMLVRLGCAKASAGKMSLAEMARWIRDKGKASICCGDETRGEGRTQAPAGQAPRTVSAGRSPRRSGG